MAAISGSCLLADPPDGFVKLIAVRGLVCASSSRGELADDTNRGTNGGGSTFPVAVGMDSYGGGGLRTPEPVLDMEEDESTLVCIASGLVVLSAREIPGREVPASGRGRWPADPDAAASALRGEPGPSTVVLVVSPALPRLR